MGCREPESRPVATGLRRGVVLVQPAVVLVQPDAKAVEAHFTKAHAGKALTTAPRGHFQLLRARGGAEQEVASSLSGPGPYGAFYFRVPRC